MLDYDEMIKTLLNIIVVLFLILAMAMAIIMSLLIQKI